ncbi:MAG: HipA domain-containing protein [Deltaproteobacteria bacterium]|nr:HipA domain-containing protein [Deltaproteobacteria bacterium]
MNFCPITYEECGDSKYSVRGLRLLSRNLSDLKDLPYTAQEQIQEAAARAGKMSIQGVQPKLSAVLVNKKQSFEIVNMGGEYILKPQLPGYPLVPENEDLTMRLAASVGIEVPLHGLVYSKDGTFTYFIKRFDRGGRKGKIAVEDFAQLSGEDRDTKYRSSMEKVVQVIDRLCTFPLIERAKLLKLVLFNFLVGNEDCHLKNFSLIRRDPKIELSPAYDLLNTTIIIRAQEEIALPLNGKKRNLTRKDFIEYFAKERLELTSKVIDGILTQISNAWTEWERLIGISFLSDSLREKYLVLLSSRRRVLGLGQSV